MSTILPWWVLVGQAKEGNSLLRQAEYIAKPETRNQTLVNILVVRDDYMSCEEERDLQQPFKANKEVDSDGF